MATYDQLEAIVFDFDGTIADSFEVFLESLTAALGRTKQLSAHEVTDMRRHSTQEVIRQLGIKKWQLPLILMRGKREITRRMNRVTVFDGMPTVLAGLSSRYQLYVMSTNSQANIAEFLDRSELSRYITKIYGDIGLLNKAKSLKKLGQQEHLESSQYLYVGDETRDIEAAQKVGIDCIAVGWGYGNPETLRSCNPTLIADKPQDILDIFK